MIADKLCLVRAAWEGVPVFMFEWLLTSCFLSLVPCAGVRRCAALPQQVITGGGGGGGGGGHC